MLISIDHYGEVASVHGDARQGEEAELESGDCYLEEEMENKCIQVMKRKRNRINTPPKENRDNENKRNKMTHAT